MKALPKTYPEKTWANLIVRARSPRQVARAICLVLVLLVAVAAFSKLAVIDRLDAAAAAEAGAAAVERDLAALQAENADFEALRLEYQRYFSETLAEGQAPAADCMAVLALIEGKLMPAGRVTSAAWAGTLLSVQLEGVSLELASVLLADLYTSPLVAGVSLSTAEDASGESAAVSMTVSLNAEGGGQG